MKRYHPLLVALHWIVAIMVLMAVFIGGPQLADIDNAHPDKMFSLTGHMVWGLAIGGLMVLRVAMRLLAQSPPEADSGSEALNKGGKLAHLGLYVLIFAMVGSGIGIAMSADLFSIVFGSSDAALPPDFSGISARAAHGIIASVITLFIVLHLVGWAYHQLIRRDGLISRMWFGKRAE